VRGIGAVDATAAGVTAGKWAEVEPGLGARVADRLQATATGFAGDGRTAAVADRKDGSELRVRWVDHLRVLGLGDVVGAATPGAWVRIASVGREAAGERHRSGDDRVAIRLRPAPPTLRCP
jgi:hypothetical protein